MRSSFLSVVPSDLFHRDRGATFQGCLVFLLILATIAWLGFTFGEAGWNYLEVRQKTREALNWAVAGNPKTDREIIQKVIDNSREAEVFLTNRNIKVTHTAETLNITVSWERDVDLPFYTVPLDLTFTLSEIKRWYRGGLVVK